MKKIFIAAALGTLMSGGTFAQEFKMPAPSPTTTISQDFSTSTIEIVYSRPGVKGRKIFGDLVPFGKEWRTGANANTKITFGEDVEFGGAKVPAGSYSIYAMPNKTSWEIVLNSSTENWGLSGYDKAKNIAVANVPVKTIKDKVESFTISLDNLTKNSADLSFTWENTKVVVPITTNNDKRIEEYIETALQGEKPPYLTAARYYFEKNKNLDNALAYTDKAIAENPKAFYMYSLKADILNKLGKKAAAIEAAKTAAEGAKGTPYEEEYQQNLKKLMK